VLLSAWVFSSLMGWIISLMVRTLYVGSFVVLLFQVRVGNRAPHEKSASPEGGGGGYCWSIIARSETEHELQTFTGEQVDGPCTSR
jgi:hypothetical protein